MALTRRHVLGFAACLAMTGPASATSIIRQHRFSVALRAFLTGSTKAIETTAGRVRGLRYKTHAVFMGIPYGTASRFMPPQAPTSWGGARDCFEFGNACRQIVPTDPISLTNSWRGTARQSEDCLNLNVWTPACDDNKRAVMVWLHYGGLIHSDAGRPFNDGARLVTKQNVVLVTVNHRIGVFGYLHLSASGLSQFAQSANLGQQDLVLALEWVRDNIEAFGGDPDRVMIFGESGGGTKVSGLLAMPSAQGLFHRAAMESTLMTTADTQEEAQTVLDAIVGQFGWTRGQADRLLNVSGQRLLDAYTATVDVDYSALRPVVDGSAMTHNPRDVLPSNVPFLVGHNRTETTITAPQSDFDITWEQMPARVSEFIGPSVTGAWATSDWRQLKPNDKPNEVLFEMETAAGKSISIDNFADNVKAAGGTAYRYCLGWRTPVNEGKWMSPHMLDLPMVFDTVGYSRSIIGNGRAEAQKVADTMSKAWADFAKTGNPGWSAYTTASKQTMMFNVESGKVNDPFGQERAILGR